MTRFWAGLCRKTRSGLSAGRCPTSRTRFRPGPWPSDSQSAGRSFRDNRAWRLSHDDIEARVREVRWNRPVQRGARPALPGPSRAWPGPPFTALYRPLPPDSGVPLPARRGGRAQHDRPARRPTVLSRAAPHRRARHGRGRSRRLFRPAPAPRGAQAAVGFETPRRDPRHRLTGRDAQPLRRSGLHGVRHARRESHAGRLAQPLLPARPRTPGHAVPRRGVRTGAAAHPGGQCAEPRHRRSPGVRPAGATARRARPAHPRLRGAVRELGKAMLEIAQLIKADVGLQVAFADVTGWDTHVNQGASEGQLAARLSELGQALTAFAQDLGDKLDDVVVLTMSEFGRTVRENGNSGTDHGHATAMLVLGGPVNGGRVLGKWPGLDPANRFEGRDVAVTTDFRDLFAEVLARHLGARDLSTVFPGFTADPTRFPGAIS